MHRFYAPPQWKVPVAICLVIVWAFLQRAVGYLWALVVLLLLLAVVAVVWHTVRRTWWS